MIAIVVISYVGKKVKKTNKKKKKKLPERESETKREPDWTGFVG